MSFCRLQTQEGQNVDGIQCHEKLELLHAIQYIIC